MDIEVGDKVTYIDKQGKQCTIIVLEDKGEASDGTDSSISEILKIERPKYEVVEEKKELLTEEEREFLRQVLIFVDIKISSINISIEILKNKKEICLNQNEDGSGLGYWYYVKNSFFNGLEIDKVYTLKELGLEEN